MSNNSVWTFSLTTPLKDDDSSDEDEGNQSHNSKPEDQDMNLSSREAALKYTPNPFSIAKINAAVRSRNIPSAMFSNLQDHDPTIRPKKHHVSQRQEDIREAFRRQAQRSHTGLGVGLRQTRMGSESERDVTGGLTSPTACAFGEALKSVSEACPGSDCDNSIDFITQSESTKHVVTPATTRSDEHDIETHIYSDFSAGQDIHAGWLTLPKNPYIVTPHPRSSPVRQLPKRLTLQPSFVPPTVNTPGKLGFSSPIFGRLQESTTQRPFKPRPPEFSPAVRLRTDYRSAASPPYSCDASRNPVKDSLDGRSTYPPYATPTVVPVTRGPSFHSPGFVDDINLASDDTLVQSPILSCPNPIFETGPLGHNWPASGRLRNPDEEWTTLPPKKSRKGAAPTVQGPRKRMIKPVEKSSSPAAEDQIHLSVDTSSIARRYPRTQTLKRNVGNYVHLGTGISPIIFSSVVKSFGLLRPCLEFRVVGVFSQTVIVRWRANQRSWSGIHELL